MDNQKILYFDVEYANSKNRSICQIGLLSEFFPSNEPVYPERNIYINPEDGFDKFCIDIHNITSDKVKDKPNFPIVWEEIKKYFDDAIIVGHNIASADLNTLVRSLKRYNLEIPSFKYICTLDLAKKYIPLSEINSYSLTSVCNYFDIDTDNLHDAFDDACACSDIFKALVEKYNININDHIKEFQFNDNQNFKNFIDKNKKLNSIVDFYGMIKGFELDKKIVKEEFDYIVNWTNENSKYTNDIEFVEIISTIDKIIEDGIITLDELQELKQVVKNIILEISANPITIATQTLNGILKGMVIDNVVTTEEGKYLRKWLYKHLELRNHYPFEQIIDLLEVILEDNVITKEESDFLVNAINDILNPLNGLKRNLYSLFGKHVCLTGNFSHGKKSDIEKLLVADGCVIDNDVTRKTDLVIIGASDCIKYAYGEYGKKVQRAIEYNCKGFNIQIMKEDEYFDYKYNACGV